MTYQIEKDWITEAGLRAVVIVRFWDGPAYLKQRYRYKKYRCGYVGVPPLHPLYGVHYYQKVLHIPKGAQTFIIKETSESIAPENVCNVHGGLTYSGNGSYPVPSDEWWFGFDCAHVGDGYIEIPPGEMNILGDGPPRSLEYCWSECERLARQLKEIGEGKLPFEREEA